MVTTLEPLRAPCGLVSAVRALHGRRGSPNPTPRRAVWLPKAQHAHVL